MLNRKILTTYIRQQMQLGLPEYIMSRDLIDSLVLKRLTPQNKASTISTPQTVRSQVASVVKNAVEASKLKTRSDSSTSALSRLSSLRSVDSLIKNKKEHVSIPLSQQPQTQVSTSAKSKRDALKDLYSNGCSVCHLAKSRNKWVFGGGNAEAQIMVIGEAPGAEEDAQGLPFVGAAGQLLTTMLSAIKLDRNKDVFITNVLKCHPPSNRSPESTEIQLCLPLLIKQIEIIRPKAILLLGRISAHALLGTSESIANLRSKVHDYKGIPTMVIYHPAALLRNSQYKRPTWEDLQKFQQLIENLGVYGSSK